MLGDRPQSGHGEQPSQFIGGEGATFGSTKRQQRTHGDHAAEADELSPVRWRGQMSGGAHQNVLVAERRKLRGVV